MPMANPRRNVSEESIRIQEHTGGFRPREMLGDYDVNPNENADGLSHISQYGASSQETMDQMDEKKRKKKALEEMEGDLVHISIKPEDMAETLNRTPMMEGESDLHESAMGVDMGHASNGIGISAGAATGPVRREGPGLIFSRSNEAFEDAWSLVKDERFDDMEEDIRQGLADELQARYEDEFDQTETNWTLAEVRGDPSTGEGAGIGLSGSTPAHYEDAGWPNVHQEAMAEGQFDEGQYKELQEGLHESVVDAVQHHIGLQTSGRMADFDPEKLQWFHPTPIDVMTDEEGNPIPHRFGANEERERQFQEFLASEDPVFLSDISKAKRKKRGRKYEEDEESEEEEAKSKKKHKREKKRKMKRGKQEASRQPHSKTARRAASAEQNLSRGTKRQAFAPRRMFSGNPRAKDMPLRLRDPVAYQRKLAAEKFRREMGALPTGHSAHADTRGIGGQKIQTIGMGGKGTKLPSSPSGSRGTTFKRPKTAERDAALLHDPLSGDPLKMLKRATMETRGTDKGLSRTDIEALKREVKRLKALIERLAKSPPELGAEAKRGNQASEEKNSAPTGGTKNLKGWEFDDTSLMLVAGAGAGKR